MVKTSAPTVAMTVNLWLGEKTLQGVISREKMPSGGAPIQLVADGKKGGAPYDTTPAQIG
jgi:hypothetical protein